MVTWNAVTRLTLLAVAISFLAIGAITLIHLRWGWGELFRRTIAWMRQIKQSRPDDALPRHWIWWSFLMAVASFIWGWLLGNWGFFQNVLASLVLVAPGLLLTNIVASNWRRRGEARRIKNGLIGVLDVVVPVFGFVVSLSLVVSPRVPQRFELDLPADPLTPQQMIDVLWRVERLLAIVPLGPDLEPGPYLESGLELPVARISGMTRRVQIAMRHMSSLHDYPKMLIKGDELAEALNLPLPCQVREKAVDSAAGLKVVDRELAVGPRFVLGDLRQGDLVTVTRNDLAAWATNVLHPLKQLLSEIVRLSNRLDEGRIEESYSWLDNFEVEWRLVEKPR